MVRLLILLNVFFVSFADKPTTGVPALSERALEQRQKWGIAIDELDYPVSQVYLDSLSQAGALICHTSRWTNGATVKMSDAQAEQVRKMAFVTDVEKTREDDHPLSAFRRPAKYQNIQTEELEIDLSINQAEEQLRLYNLLPLHDAGFEGQGIVMAVCDAGFTNADTLRCFRQEELELGHFDFSDDKDDFYGEKGSHGTLCLSTISGQNGHYKGAATQAQYYLMRSEENNTESPKEMDNMEAALEKADSLGVNIFSVSLGYSKFDNSEWNLTHEDLTGSNTRLSRAATIAARKGMLVCVAAGNEGTTSWNKINVPADADSVLTVGAVDTDSIIADFSSYGPTADGRVKPDVCAVGKGTVLIGGNGSITRSNGTSFSTPLLAGMAATLWSALPDKSAMQIRELIIRSADRYNTPDPVRYGYGIPDAWNAYIMGGGSESFTGLQYEETGAYKIIRGTEIRIVRNGKTFNMAGQRVE